MSSRGVISVEEDQVCELCGAVAECRPYGPNGEQICFDCGQKDPDTTLRKMKAYLFGIEEDSAES